MKTLENKCGPERTFYTMKKPSDEITFNSIKDNNVVGNEANFVRIGESGSSGKLVDKIVIEREKQYSVWIFYHNDAKPSLREGGMGNAVGVRVFAGLTSWTLNSDKPVLLQGIISSENSIPGEVWDSCSLSTESEEDITLKYVKGSAKIYNQGKINGAEISDDIFRKGGVLIGHDALDGVIPCCTEYSGHIIFRLSAE